MEDGVKNLEELVKKYFEQSRYKHKYKQKLLKDRWGKVMGKVVMNRTQDITLNDKGLLIVKISSSPLRQQIMIDKEKVLTALNKTDGEKILGIALL